MEKIKVISITPNSPIVTDEKHANDLRWKISNEWASQEDFEMKKRHPSVEIEGWMHSKDVKKTEEIEINNVKFKVFPTDFSVRHGMEVSIKMLKTLVQEMKAAEEKKIILHFHEYHSWQSYLMLLLARNKKVKIIAQHHGGRSPLKNLSRYRRLVLFLPVIIFMQFFENLLFKKVSCFYALSDEEADYLRKLGARNINFRTMGIQDKYFLKTSKNDARKRLGLKDDKKYALFLSRIKTTKGIKEIIDAIKFVDAELLIIGTGQDKEKYERYALDNNVKNVKFLGAIFSDKKLDYLSACDCLVLPSYTEGAPVVIMEAVARNLPVVATKVGGIPKMIQNGREGLLINAKSSDEIKNALRKVLSWNKKDIRKYAEKYKWKKIITETYEDYIK